MADALPEAKNDRSHWKIKKFSSHKELRILQNQEWQNVSGAARRQAAWELVEDYWVNQRAMSPDELRLQRAITNGQRGEG